MKQKRLMILKLIETKTKRWYCTIVASNGQTLARTAYFKTKLQLIDKLVSVFCEKPNEQPLIYSTHKKEWRWKFPNTQAIIFSSEAYKSKQHAKKMADLVLNAEVLFKSDEEQVVICDKPTFNKTPQRYKY